MDTPSNAPAHARRRISTEPLINWLHERIVHVALAAYTAALIQVCLVPLHIDRGVLRGDGVSAWKRFLYPIFNLPDIIANLALYVPLGALGYLAGRRVGHGRLAAGIIAVGWGFCLSLFCEGMQALIPERVSSIVDLACNGLGAGIGVLLAAIAHASLRRAKRALRQELRAAPGMIAAKLFTCGVLLLQLRPYDIVREPVVAFRAIRDARVSPLAEWRSLSRVQAVARRGGRNANAAELLRGRWDYLLDRAADVAIYGALAAIVAVSLRRHEKRGFASAAAHGVMAAGSIGFVVTALRMLEPSRGLDTAHFLAALAGGVGGAPLALAWLLRRGDTPLTGRTPGWALFALVSAFLLLRGVAPAVLRTDASGSIALGRLNLLPLAVHAVGRPNEAFLDITSKMLLYAVWAGALALCLRSARISWRRRTLLTIGIAAATATMLEASHLFIAARRADVTGILLAIGGAAGGAIFLRWVRDYAAHHRVRVVEDLLTSQLIEGPRIEPLPGATRTRAESPSHPG